MFDARPTELAGPVASGCRAGRGGRDRARRLDLRAPRRRRAGARLDVLALAALAHFTGLALEGAALTIRSPRGARARLARPPQRRPAHGWAAVAFAASRSVTRSVRRAAARADRRTRPTRSRPPARCSRSRPPRSPSAASTTQARRSCRRPPRSSLLYLASVEVVTLGGGGAGPARRCSASCGRSRASARSSAA